MKNDKKVPESKLSYTELVQQRPNRKSMSERLLLIASDRTYPHSSIGCVVVKIYGNSEQAACSALSSENRLELLEYIGQLRFECKDGELSFYYDKFKLTSHRIKPNDLPNLPLEASRPYYTDNMSSFMSAIDEDDLLRTLLNSFARIRNNTLKRRSTKPIINEFSLTVMGPLKVNGEGKDLSDLSVERKVTKLTFEESIVKLRTAFFESEYKIVFGVDYVKVETPNYNYMLGVDS